MDPKSVKPQRNTPIYRNTDLKFTKLVKTVQLQSAGQDKNYRKTAPKKLKKKLENKHLGNGDYFVLMASSSHPLLSEEYAANGPVEVK